MTLYLVFYDPFWQILSRIWDENDAKDQMHNNFDNPSLHIIQQSQNNITKASILLSDGLVLFEDLVVTQCWPGMAPSLRVGVLHHRQAGCGDLVLKPCSCGVRTIPSHISTQIDHRLTSAAS